MKKLFYLLIVMLLTGFTLTGCGDSSTGPRSDDDDEDETPTYTVDISVTPSGGGSVSPSASDTYEEGEDLELTAESNEGYTFVEWTGRGQETSNTLSFTVDQDYEITAHFEKKTYPLAVEITGEGTVDENVIQPKSTDYEHGTVVELTANPDEGWKFVEWQGDLSGSDNPKQITVEEAKDVTAVFEKKSYALTVNTDGNGAVNEEVIQPKSTDYDYGTVVELTANPDAGWKFVEWQGDLNGTTSPKQITVDDPKEVTAVFEKKEFMLDVQTNGQGSVSTSPDQSTYAYGTSVTLTATPAQGWSFAEWDGDLLGSEASQTLTINANKTVTATFEQQQNLFYLADNGVTIKCPEAEVGDKGTVDGTEYTKRSRNQIIPANASTTCTSGISYMVDLFKDASTFNGDIGSWDVSKVTNMKNMFKYAYAFNQDISNWDVSSVEDMSYMFFSADAFNKDLGGWDVSSVTSMAGLFGNTENFDQNLNSWDVKNVKDMTHMFAFSSSFNGDISDWETRSVEKMQGMFASAKKFNGDINEWDVSSVTDMSEMFKDNNVFNKNINGWNTANVTDMRYMFENADAFNQDLDNWETGSVTDMESMFIDAENFAGDISTWDVSSVTNMHEMFREATKFTSHLSNWDVGKVENFAYMFYNAKTFNSNLNDWNMSSATSIYAMFGFAESFNSNLNKWNVSSLTSLEKVFKAADNFNGSVGDWDVSNVTNMEDMFRSATSFNKPIGSWDVSNVIYMDNMLYGTLNFDQDLSGWDVSENFGCASYQHPDFKGTTNISEDHLPKWGAPCTSP